MIKKSQLGSLQQQVMQFVQAHELEAPVSARVLDLVSELGELSKEVLKGSRYGRLPFQPTGEWANELGDIFFSLICIANSTGVELETALEGALIKYGERLNLKGDLESGR